MDKKRPLDGYIYKNVKSPSRHLAWRGTLIETTIGRTGKPDEYFYYLQILLLVRLVLRRLLVAVAVAVVRHLVRLLESDGPEIRTEPEDAVLLGQQRFGRVGTLAGEHDAVAAAGRHVRRPVNGKLVMVLLLLLLLKMMLKPVVDFVLMCQAFGGGGGVVVGH